MPKHKNTKKVAVEGPGFVLNLDTGYGAFFAQYTYDDPEKQHHADRSAEQPCRGVVFR